MQRRTFVESGAVIGLALGAIQAPAATSALRIGLTAVILADQAAFLARWSDYLSARIGIPVVFVARESYQSILDLLFSSQLDAAWICGYPYVLHQKKLQLLSVPLYQGAPYYRSYLIGKQGDIGGPRGWADLKNRVLAYSDPLSNSGWLVAQAQLRSVGLRSGDLRRAFFAHGHRNVAESVATGLAHAGCIDGYVLETMQLQRMAVAAETQILWKSELYAFPPIVARHDDKNPALPALVDALLKMREDSQGMSLLEAFNLSGFAKPGLAIYDSIKALAINVGAMSA